MRSTRRVTMGVQLGGQFGLMVGLLLTWSALPWDGAAALPLVPAAGCAGALGGVVLALAFTLAESFVRDLGGPFRQAGSRVWF